MLLLTGLLLVALGRTAHSRRLEIDDEKLKERKKEYAAGCPTGRLGSLELEPPGVTVLGNLPVPHALPALRLLAALVAVGLGQVLDWRYCTRASASGSLRSASAALSATPAPCIRSFVRSFNC